MNQDTDETKLKPSIGRVVHYQKYGTPIIKKGRNHHQWSNHWSTKTHCKSGHEFNSTNTRIQIRRDCMICVRSTAARYRVKKKLKV